MRRLYGKTLHNYTFRPNPTLCGGIGKRSDGIPSHESDPATLWPAMTKREAKQRFEAECEPLDGEDIAERGVRRLACAVILRALGDLQARDDEHKASARRFFDDDESYLSFWAKAIDLDPAAIRAKAEELARGRGSGQPRPQRRPRRERDACDHGDRI